MRQILAAGTAILLSALSASASHQKLPSRKQAELMLQQSADALNLWEAGTPPYHLSAEVHLEIGGRGFDGNYDVWWAAPDKFREGFLMPAQGGAIAEIDVARGDKFYVLRNTPTLSIPVWETQNALRDVLRRIHETEKSSIRSIHWHSGRQQMCIGTGVAVAPEITSYCFDATGKLVSVDMKPNEETTPAPLIDAMEKTWVWRLNQFTGLAGGKRFPHHIEVSQYGLSLTIIVKALEATSHFASETFEPPAHATVFPWCSDPTTRFSKHLDEMPIPRTRAPGIYIAYYVYVQPDGRVSKVVPVSSGGDAIDNGMEDWLRKHPYATRTCGDQPIPWESILVLPEAIQ
jgi:hypothetical protein